jgi:hypothetical protein
VSPAAADYHARALGVAARRFTGRIVLASSMVVYGEGGYRCPEHGRVPATNLASLVRRPKPRRQRVAKGTRALRGVARPAVERRLMQGGCFLPV